MNLKSYWNEIHRTKPPDQVSWFQREATRSLRLMQEVAPARNSAILDVGGGASTLVDGLLALGYQQLTVLDISTEALARAQQRLGGAADRIVWLEASVLDVALPARGFDLWHDRAGFHFLTSAADRRRYVDQVRRTLRPSGHLLLATFAEDGPARCSGLEVRRYSREQLHEEFGAGFKMLASEREEHVTPSGARQAFTYCLFRYEPAKDSAVS
ncbi:MAG: class I SAM-dependent methyltransferase [Gemmatimonadales bacterium]